jgi:hypothetical protein
VVGGAAQLYVMRNYSGSATVPNLRAGSKMMRLTLSAALFLIVAASVGAVNFGQCQSGEYAGYIDERSSAPYYRTYMLVRSGKAASLFVRSVDLSTMQDSAYQVELTEQEAGPPQVASVRHIGGLSTEEHQRAIRDIEYFVGVAERYVATGNEPREIDEAMPKFGYTMRLLINSYLPLFRIARFGKVGEEPSYYIDKAGLFPYDKTQLFWSLGPWLPKQVKDFPTQLQLKHGIPFVVTISGLNLEIDNNWTRQRTDAYDGYLISKASKRDAQITVEKYLGLQVISNSIRSSLLGVYGPYLLPMSVVAKEMSQFTSIEFDVVDSSSFVTYYRERFYSIDKSISILNFSAWRSVYKKNIAYFERILQSVGLQ